MQTRTQADVQAALDELGIQAAIRTFEVSTATAQQAADAIGADLGSIVKSLCFLVEGKPVLVLTAGDRQVDDRKLAAIRGTGRKKVKIADAETTMSVTGFSPGGVSPLGLSQSLPIFIDDSLGRFETVYAAAGAPNAIFPIRFADLVRITQAAVIDVTRSREDREDGS